MEAIEPPIPLKADSSDTTIVYTLKPIYLCFPSWDPYLCFMISLHYEFSTYFIDRPCYRQRTRECWLSGYSSDSIDINSTGFTRQSHGISCRCSWWAGCLGQHTWRSGRFPREIQLLGSKGCRSMCKLLGDGSLFYQ